MRRDGRIDERIDRCVTEQREHSSCFGGVVAGVAAGKGVGLGEKSGGRRHECEYTVEAVGARAIAI